LEATFVDRSRKLIGARYLLLMNGTCSDPYSCLHLFIQMAHRL
jgi:hypothetical protein